jgi:hypothetical protein
VIALLACARPPLEAVAAFAPPMALAYVEHVSPGGLADVTVGVTETTVRSDAEPPAGWPGPVWETTTVYADGRRGQVTRYVAGDRGVAWFATVAPDGVETRFEPKVALPAAVRPGDAWAGEHGDHGRACEAGRTPFCRDGIATTCTTRWSDRATWMRQHWCRDLGWVGFELVTVGDSGAPVAFWSTGATRDGQPLPDVPIGRRPLPVPEVRSRP